MSRLQPPVFSKMTLVFTSFTDTDNKKKTVIKALEEVENVFLLDEYRNGFKYLFKNTVIGDVYDALKEHFVVTRIDVQSDERELFAALTIDKQQTVDPSSSSFRELDQDRMRNLF